MSGARSARSLVNRIIRHGSKSSIIDRFHLDPLPTSIRKDTHQ